MKELLAANRARLAEILRSVAAVIGGSVAGYVGMRLPIDEQTAASIAAGIAGTIVAAGAIVWAAVTGDVKKGAGDE